MNAPLIEWSDQLVLGQDVMDDTHREFVVQLNRIGAATDDAMLAAIDEFIVHTESHFGEEERWMNECGFPPVHCHTGQHQVVVAIGRHQAECALAQAHHSVELPVKSGGGGEMPGIESLERGAFGCIRLGHLEIGRAHV